MSIYHNDCLDSLGSFKNNSVNLIYLDPPFYTQRTHTLKTRDNSKEYSFQDSWESMKDYIEYLKPRIEQCQRVLKDTGSIFLHCDKSASHYLRVLLDEIFGSDNFQSEIIWAYRRWSNSKKGLLNGHQTIYFYSKTKDFKFNTIYTDYSPTTNVDQILQERFRNGQGKSAYKLDDSGNVVIGKEKKGVPLSDVWSIPYLNPKAKERTGYPTQKPIILLEQIIKLVTDEGDIVLDPFCGSGTTLVAASLLNRNYIGIDISSDAIDLTKTRLASPIRTTSFLLEKGEDDYINKSEYEMQILNNLNAIPIQRNGGMDGLLKETYLGKPIAVKIQKQDEDIAEAESKLVKASKKKGCLLAILVRTKNSRDNLFNSGEPFKALDNILLVDSYDLIVNKWLYDFGNDTKDITECAAQS